MDKKTQTWLEIAENDLEFAGQVLENKQRPPYALLFCHQAIEKILKAVVQHVTGSVPPRTHSLELLLQIIKKELPSEKMDTLIKLAPHYLSTRYPDDLAKFYKQYSDEFVQSHYEATRDLFLWIKKNWLI